VYGTVSIERIDGGEVGLGSIRGRDRTGVSEGLGRGKVGVGVNRLVYCLDMGGVMGVTHISRTKVTVIAGQRGSGTGNINYADQVTEEKQGGVSTKMIVRQDMQSEVDSC
jgi:hypothetical protein